MPTNVVKTPEDEEKWQKAKEVAEEAGHGDNYAYIMGVYKKMNPERFKAAGGSRTMYHFGKRAPQPKPKATGRYPSHGEEGWARPWIPKNVKSGVFLTDNWVNLAERWPGWMMYSSPKDLAKHFSQIHLYVFEVPMWVLKAAGGVGKYHNVNWGAVKGTGDKLPFDMGWREAIIPDELWEHVKLKGKVATSKVLKKLQPLTSRGRPKRLTSPGGQEFAVRSAAFRSAPGGKLLGFKVMGYDPDTKEAISGANSRLRLKLTRGAVHKMPGKGIFLGASPKYVLDYYAGHDLNALITYSFDPSEVTSGSLDDREPEITVPKARVEKVEFFDADLDPVRIASDKAAAVDEKLMDRAAQILQYHNERDAMKHLIKEGVSKQDAYFAVKAGKLLNKSRMQRRRVADRYVASKVAAQVATRFMGSTDGSSR